MSGAVNFEKRLLLKVKRSKRQIVLVFVLRGLG